MDLAAVIKAVMAPLEAQRSGDGLQDFHPGDRLFGRVVKIEEDGRVLMDLGRSRVLARIAFPVQPGQILNLQVVETGAILHLRTEVPKGEMPKDALPVVDFSTVLTGAQQDQLIHLADRLASLHETAPQNVTVPDAIQQAGLRVAALSENLPLEKSVDQIALWIKAAVENQGVYFEKRLADGLEEEDPMAVHEKGTESPRARTALLATRDIKAHLLILRTFLDKSSQPQWEALKLGPKQVDELQKSVERLLKHVEQQQQQTVARWETGETRHVMVHVLPLAQQQAPVRFKVYYHRKNGKQEGVRPQQIALLLDLDNLGAVRVDLALIAEKLHVRFFVDSETIRTRFQKEIHSVETSLSACFSRVQCDIYVSPEKITQFHTEDASAAVSGRIDISA